MEENQNFERPVGVERRALKREGTTQRYTVDLEKTQRRSLALWAAEWDVDKSNIVRGLILLLESEPEVRAKLQAVLFADSE